MKFKYVFLSVLSGLLLALAFPNVNFYVVVWVALFPLLFVISHVSPKKAFVCGFACGLVFFAGHLYWLLSLFAFVDYVAILAWIALSTAEALIFGVFASISSYFFKRQSIIWNIIIIPCLWVLLEYLRSIGPWGFSWGVLGYSQQPNPIIFQVAGVTGILGVSFLIIFVNVFILAVWDYFVSKEKVPIVRVGLIVFVILLVALGAGTYFSSGEQQGNFIKVALVQANISQEEKWQDNGEDDIISAHTQLTAKAKSFKPFLVVWPETAIPDFFNLNADYSRRVKRISKNLESYLLFGGLYLDEQGRQYNSAYLVSSYGKVLARYYKIKLVLFGEYVPDLPVFSHFKTVAGLGENTTGGKKVVTLSTSQGNLGAVICFESADFDICRKMVRKGADVLVVITNDAWFGRSAASAQHLQISAARAVENGTYLIQAANSGISGIIGPDGQIKTRTKLFERTVLTGKAAFMRKRTFYNRFGNIFPYLCIILVISDFIFLAFARRGVKKSSLK